MPYITQEHRDGVNEAGLTGVVALIEHEASTYGPMAAAGLTGYAVYRLMLAAARPKRFMTLALAVGVVLCVLLRFFQKVVSPYEDEKQTENGDVL